MAVSSETVAQLLGSERGPLARWLVGAVRVVRAIGRRPLGAFGLITIANSDAAAAAYSDHAMDQAYRAVNELIAAKAT